MSAHIAVGDTVTVGVGQKQWSVTEFWNSQGFVFAGLQAVDGYTRTSVEVDRLKQVTS